MGGDWAPAAAIASVAFSICVYYTATAWFAHRERMAKIAKGINPDAPAPENASKSEPSKP